MWFIFSTPVLIRHLWQLKTVVFQHWCLIHAVLMLVPVALTSPEITRLPLLLLLSMAYQEFISTLFIMVRLVSALEDSLFHYA